MIRRPPRSTHCISSAASDVYKRQVVYFLGRALTVNFHCLPISFAVLGCFYFMEHIKVLSYILFSSLSRQYSLLSLMVVHLPRVSSSLVTNRNLLVPLHSEHIFKSPSASLSHL
eukprot:TRINITY_DN16100_c0_g1_i5.p1 TRINITY_DN16100_c0_g1~~TRINITY_DN16100_c0_g1_i5.p1  ORF type:complete len:123 (+),score=8.26 TRINITY_DN16100_c0_g1_i5:28-369(+)